MDWNQSTMYEQRVRFILEVPTHVRSFAAESCRRYGISQNRLDTRGWIDFSGWASRGAG